MLEGSNDDDGGEESVLTRCQYYMPTSGPVSEPHVCHLMFCLSNVHRLQLL
jgi:hypothetical protein